MRVLAWVASAFANGNGGPPPVILAEEPAPKRSASGGDSMLAYEASGWGVGVSLGLPTGFSVANRRAGRMWYEGAVAWSFDRATLDLNASMLVTLGDLRTPDLPDLRFPLSMGVGPRVRLGDNQATNNRAERAVVGVGVPISGSVMHDGVPLEAFLEFVPGIALYPSTDAFFDVAVGGRFYLPPKKRAASP